MIAIRKERPGDVAGIHATHVACFPGEDEANLVDALRDNDRLLVSLVAVDDDGIIGHVAFSPVSADQGNPGVGLAPVAVTEANRCRGIAAKLIIAGLHACRDAGYGWAVVLGEPRYYGRFGFMPASKLGLDDEYGGEDAFAAVELLPNQLPTNAGLVKYCAEFAAFE